LILVYPFGTFIPLTKKRQNTKGAEMLNKYNGTRPKRLTQSCFQFSYNGHYGRNLGSAETDYPYHTRKLNSLSELLRFRYVTKLTQAAKADSGEKNTTAKAPTNPQYFCPALAVIS